MNLSEASDRALMIVNNLDPRFSLPYKVRIKTIRSLVRFYIQPNCICPCLIAVGFLVLHVRIRRRKYEPNY